MGEVDEEEEVSSYLKKLNKTRSSGSRMRKNKIAFSIELGLEESTDLL
jgi:hypothetical protein